MLRHWNRVIIMDNARLKRRIVMWEVIIAVISFKVFL